MPNNKKKTQMIDIREDNLQAWTLEVLDILFFDRTYTLGNVCPRGALVRLLSKLL